MELNPYQSPQTPPEPPLKKRPYDLKLFLSPFTPLILFLGTLMLLGLGIIVADWLWFWFAVRS